MTPPTSPPHDTFSASEGEGEGEAVFAGKPISRGGSRKSTMKSEDVQDEKPHAKRQKISSENLTIMQLLPTPEMVICFGRADIALSHLLPW